jgi:hypothetical protein
MQGLPCLHALALTGTGLGKRGAPSPSAASVRVNAYMLLREIPQKEAVDEGFKVCPVAPANLLAIPAHSRMEGANGIGPYR